MSHIFRVWRKSEGLPTCASKCCSITSCSILSLLILSISQFEGQHRAEADAHHLYHPLLGLMCVNSPKEQQFFTLSPWSGTSRHCTLTSSSICMTRTCAMGVNDACQMTCSVMHMVCVTLIWSSLFSWDIFQEEG